MRYQGRLEKWKDDSGYGFVTPNGGGVRAFVHISNFENRQRRPKEGDIINYVVEQDASKRVRAAHIRFSDEQGNKRVTQITGRTRVPGGVSSSSRFGNFLLRLPLPLLLLVLIGVFVAWNFIKTENISVAPITSMDAYGGTMSHELSQPSAQVFSCDGRQHCSQMSSCEEATFFIQNCPDTQMDGDLDGIPCEGQFCGH